MMSWYSLRITLAICVYPFMLMQQNYCGSTDPAYHSHHECRSAADCQHLRCPYGSPVCKNHDNGHCECYHHHNDCHHCNYHEYRCLPGENHSCSITNTGTDCTCTGQNTSRITAPYGGCTSDLECRHIYCEKHDQVPICTKDHTCGCGHQHITCNEYSDCKNLICGADKGQPYCKHDHHCSCYHHDHCNECTHDKVICDRHTHATCHYTHHRPNCTCTSNSHGITVHVTNMPTSKATPASANPTITISPTTTAPPTTTASSTTSVVTSLIGHPTAASQNHVSKTLSPPTTSANPINSHHTNSASSTSKLPPTTTTSVASVNHTTVTSPTVTTRSLMAQSYPSFSEKNGHCQSTADCSTANTWFRLGQVEYPCKFSHLSIECKQQRCLCNTTPQTTTTTMTTTQTTTTQTPTTLSGVMCHQCGDLANGLPCTSHVIHKGTPSPCTTGSYCQTDVLTDVNGNQEIYKRCVDQSTCLREWLQLTSDKDYCIHYDNSKNTGPYKCSFCCVGDGCNTNIFPLNSTLYGGFGK